MRGLARARAVSSSIRRPAGSCSVHSPAMSSKRLTFEPRVAEQGAAVAPGDQGEVLGDEVADAEVLLGFVDAGGVHEGAGEPEVLDPGTAVPATRPAGGLHAAAEGQGQGGPLVLPVARHQQQPAAAGLQGGGREEVVAPAVHVELLHGEQGVPFAEDVCSRLTELTGQFK